MTVEFKCRDCQTILRVSEAHIGKKARCPNCGSIQDVVGQSQQTFDQPSQGFHHQQQDRWLMRTPDGAEYGPVTKSDLDHWMREGRVSSQCSLRQENQTQWNPASLVYPNLASASSAPSPQVSSSGNPFASPTQQGGPRNPQGVAYRPHSGTSILVMAIIGFFCLGIILGPIAWSKGHSELKAIDRGEVDPQGRGTVMAGYVIGIIVTCLNVLYLVLACVVNLAALN